MKSLLPKLKKYLKTNSKSELANKLGYSSTQTIDAWFRRNSIPKNRVPELKTLLGVK